MPRSRDAQLLRAFADVYKERRVVEAAEGVIDPLLREEVFRRMRDGDASSSTEGNSGVPETDE